LQLLVPTNPHWVRVVGYGPFSFCVIHKESLCPSSGDMNGLMMMICVIHINPSLQSLNPIKKPCQYPYTYH
jgi:hypothetical protein